jgi:hypothetical protein
VQIQVHLAEKLCSFFYLLIHRATHGERTIKKERSIREPASTRVQGDDAQK